MNTKTTKDYIKMKDALNIDINRIIRKEKKKMETQYRQHLKKQKEEEAASNLIHEKALEILKPLLDYLDKVEFPYEVHKYSNSVTIVLEPTDYRQVKISYLDFARKNPLHVEALIDCGEEYDSDKGGLRYETEHLSDVVTMLYRHIYREWVDGEVLTPEALNFIEQKPRTS